MDPKIAATELFTSAATLDDATSQYTAGTLDSVTTLYAAYQQVIDQRAALVEWVGKGGFRPALYLQLLNIAGHVLNGADSAHYMLTGEWVPIEA